MEMDNHVLDKEDGCYDNTDATFSDDEEELNNKGKAKILLAVNKSITGTKTLIKNCLDFACLSQGKKREFRFHQLKETYIDEPADITPFVDQLDEALKERVLQLQKGR